MKFAGCADSDASGDACLALREKIKAVELEAEQLQQRTLEKLTAPLAGEARTMEEIAAATAANLKRYLGRQGVRLDQTARSELTHIVLGCGDFAERESVLETIKTTFAST